MDEVEIFRRSEADAIRVRAQLMGLEHMLGVKEGFAAQIFGESRTRFEGDQRQTVNRIYADYTIFTVFHEEIGMASAARPALPAESRGRRRSPSCGCWTG